METPIPDPVLRQYLAGALEPPERERVERALANPAVRERLGLLVATTPAPETGWVVPPPAVARLGWGPALGGVVEAAAVMGEDSGWVTLGLDVPETQLDHHVIVLERVTDVWEVVFPGLDEPGVRAADLPRARGRVSLDLAVPSDPLRVAVVLVPPSQWPPPGAARWSGVQEGLAAGSLSAASFDVVPEGT